MDQEPSNSKQVTSILPLNHNSNYKFIIEMMMKMATMTTTITFSEGNLHRSSPSIKNMTTKHWQVTQKE